MAKETQDEDKCQLLEEEFLQNILKVITDLRLTVQGINLSIVTPRFEKKLQLHEKKNKKLTIFKTTVINTKLLLYRINRMN